MRGLEASVLGYLVNALWQVPLVWAAAWGMTRWARRAGPGMAHRIWVGALLAEAALPACSGDLARAVVTLCRRLVAGGGGGEVRVVFGAGAAGGAGALRLPAGVMAAVAGVYLCGVAYFAGRLAWGLWRTRGMRLRATSHHPAGRQLDWLDLRVSREIAGPVTVGAWRGVVLLPEGFLERVTEEDLRAVLAHEGAHVRRRDFGKNALYGLLTVPVAFHPALWMTRARVAESREMVCDALAAAEMTGRERYAESLLRLAALLVEGTPERMLHAIGIFGVRDANSFERRVMNLTGRRTEMTGARRAMVAVACGLAAVGTGASAVALRVGVPMQSAADQGARGGAPVRVSGGVMAGQVLTKVNPVYPPEAKEARIAGAVVLSAVIGKDGTIENLQVVSGPEQLRSSALDAVRQWTYKPYLLNGEPTEVQTTITVNYSFGG